MPVNLLALIHPGHGPAEESASHWLLSPSHLGGVVVLLVALLCVGYALRASITKE